MGASASVSDVANFVGGCGPAYERYRTEIERNGVDGSLAAEFLDESNEENLTEALAELGVESKLHVRKLTLDGRKHLSDEGFGSLRPLPSALPDIVVTDAVAKTSQQLDVFVSHSKKIDSTEDRAIWVADMLEARGLISFFDRTDLLEISEEALQAKVLSSKVMITILDPMTFNSEWVLHENIWAANAGIPIVPVFDNDRYRWDGQLDRWQKMYPWVFERQAVPLTKTQRRGTTTMLFEAVQKAKFAGIVPRHDPILVGEREFVETRVGAASSSDTETRPACESAFKRMCQKLGNQRPSLIIAAFTCTHDAQVVAEMIHEFAPEVPMAGITTCRGVAVGGSWTTHRNEYGLGLWGLRDFEGTYCVRHVYDRDKLRIREAVESGRKLRVEPPSFVLLLGSPGSEEAVLDIVHDVFGDGVPLLGGSSADNKVEGDWWQISKVGATGWNAESPHTSQKGVCFVFGWSSCEIATTMTSGFYPTPHQGKVTKIGENPRVMLEIDGRPAAEVYNEWTGGDLAAVVGDVKGQRANILGTSSFAPLGEPLELATTGPSDGGEHFRVLHPTFWNSDSSLTLGAQCREGMDVVLLSGSAETLAKKISASAKYLIEADPGTAVLFTGSGPGRQTVVRQTSFAMRKQGAFTVSECTGGLFIFCGGLVVGLQGAGVSMNTAVEQLAEAMGDKSTMGLFCFGEQGVNARREIMHGNLMYGALLFSNKPRVLQNEATQATSARAGQSRRNDEACQTASHAGLATERPLMSEEPAPLPEEAASTAG